MYLLVTIDTEEDMPDWRPEENISLKNIVSLPTLQKELYTSGVRPTYLVDRPVIDDDNACYIIRKLHEQGNCEIGMHLHSWNTPPLTEEERNGEATYLHSLPVEIQREKLAGLYAYFEQRLGLRPTSYRAGRYGFDHKSAKILSELGIEVDSSIVPGKNYTKDGGPDFTGYDLNPFVFENPENSQRLLEVPVTVDLVGSLSKFLAKRYFSIPKWTRLHGILHKLNLAKLTWLRPTYCSFQEMRQIADHVLTKTNCPVINIMFHSSECFPGTSPYNRSKEDISRFVERLLQIARYLIQDCGLTGVTLTEFAHLKRDKKLPMSCSKKELYSSLY